jgi:exopolysaccharide biosynthesis polyprenyl glycosylphosphotransferase
VPGPGGYWEVVALFEVTSLLVFWHLGLHRTRASVLNLWEVKAVLKGTLYSAALFFALMFFLKVTGYSRTVVVGAISLSAFLIIAQRRLLSSVLRSFHRRGTLGRRTLIYGCGQTGQLLLKKIVHASHLNFTVVGFLDDDAAVGSSVACRLTQSGSAIFRVPVLGRLQDLSEVISTCPADELLIAAPALSSARLREILNTAGTLNLSVGVVPQLGVTRADQLVVEDLSAIPILRSHRMPSRRAYAVGKRVFDLTVATLLLLVTAPLWAVAALMIRVGSPGPIFFVQERVGLRGRRFRMLKFRTMRVDTDPYAYSPAGDTDPRITRTGRVLRTGGFDELPQLINVLRGDMSMVGPRPEMPFIVERYTEVERLRLEALPGITGLWQISADRHAQIHENLEYDLYYINYQSFLLDLLILAETVLFTLGVCWRTITAGAAEVLTSPEGMPLPAVRASIEDGPYAHNGHAVRTKDSCIVIAVDQRRPDGTIPPTWRGALRTAQRLADGRTVKLLVSSHNRESFESLLEEFITSGGFSRHSLEYATHGGPSEIRQVVKEAQLVITDLCAVERYARDAGAEVIRVQDGDVCDTVSGPAKEVDSPFAQHPARVRVGNNGGSAAVAG